MSDDELYGLLTSAAENLRSADKDERRVDAAFQIAFKLEAYCRELSARAKPADHSTREAFEAWAMDFYGCDRATVDHFAGVDGYVIWQASRGKSDA